MSKKTVVVTGGAGFIGSHLCHRLVKEGYKVRIVDNLYRGRIGYIKDLLDNGSASLHCLDIRSTMIKDYFKDAKYVFHLAALCINYSVSHPEESFNANVIGTFNVFNSAYEAGVEKVVFASSASVYGNPQELPMRESHPLNPITPYCIAKIAGEYMLKMSMFSGLRYVTLRNFNVYGTRQPTDAYYTSVIISFAKRIMKNLPPIIVGDGSQSMDFVNIKDVVDAFVLAMTSEVTGETINVGSGTTTSIKEMANLIIELLEKDIEPIYRKGVKLIVTRRQADISKAKELLGFKPRIMLKDGLRELITDIKDNPEMY